jgi:hypothetical protein
LILFVYFTLYYSLLMFHPAYEAGEYVGDSAEYSGPECGGVIGPEGGVIGPEGGVIGPEGGGPEGGGMNAAGIGKVDGEGNGGAPAGTVRFRLL